MVYTFAPVLMLFASIYTAAISYIHRDLDAAGSAGAICGLLAMTALSLIFVSLVSPDPALGTSIDIFPILAICLLWMTNDLPKRNQSGCALIGILVFGVIAALATQSLETGVFSAAIVSGVIATAQILLDEDDRNPQFVGLAAWLLLLGAIVFFGPVPGEPLPIPDYMEGVRGYQPPEPDPVYTPLNWHTSHTLVAISVGLIGIRVRMLAHRPTKPVSASASKKTGDPWAARSLRD
jgi:hypothetical protein